MSYVSPIKIFYAEEPEEGWTDKIGKYLAGEVDNIVLQSCVKVGCHVDKDELEKALRYDRDQYVKGYEDGKRDAAAAIEALQAEVEELKAKKMKLAENSLRFVGKVRELDKRRLEPKRGEWIMDGRYTRHCSICNESVAWPEKYCPNCGAKMEVQDESVF